MSKEKSKNLRLSPYLTGTHYEVLLKPDLESHTFSGEETITLSIGKSTNTISIHSKDLEILSATLFVGKNVMQAKTISYDTKIETVTFSFEKKIQKGNPKLHLVFRGILSDTMRGFYKSQYVVDGEERYMATTQFEATDARRCIPCFDEPAHKATFDVHLVVADGKTAISNTLPISVRAHEAGYKIVSFARTPKMSTYLLAFLVGDFEWVEKKTKRGVLVRVLTVPGKKAQAKFALDVGVRCLEFYEKYFDIAYPLNTLDMIAVPDFASGAMENWGAVTYRETALLVDDAHSSTAARERVAEVIAHELAHQWFGNLVTMEWWTHLWLNEGFASYIPYLALDELFPEWNVWEDFPISMLATALSLDALLHTHPIEVDVHDPNEISEIFDGVSYNKGASIIRMLAEYIGAKNFRDGLRYYLKKHSYKNASTVHLWEAFEKVSGKPVRSMMSVWTRKSGYPILSVAEKKEGVLTVEQERFFSSPVSQKKIKDTTKWPVPLLLATSRGEKTLGLMTTKKANFRVDNLAWYKINPREGGVYRTRYDASLYGRLMTPIREGRLSAPDRLGVIRDSFSAARSGRGPISDSLDLLEAYKGETEYMVWTNIIGNMRGIFEMLEEDKVTQEAFRIFASNYIDDLISRVGWEPRTNEKHSDIFLRSLALSAGVTFGHTATITEARKRFKNRSKEIIDADLRLIVYSTIARTGGEKEYKELLSMYKKETLHEERNRILRALCLFENPVLIKRTLDFILSKDVRLQDQIRGFAGIFSNRKARVLGWQFLKKNWKSILASYGQGNHLISHTVSVLEFCMTKELYVDIKKFFKKTDAPGAERTVDQTLEYIEAHLAWRRSDAKKVRAWLKKQP